MRGIRKEDVPYLASLSRSTPTLTNDLLMFASKHGHRLFRCNSGSGWQGTVINEAESATCSDRKKGHILKLLNPRRFHAHKRGTPDLNGWTIVKITPEMVGKTFPIATAIEIKTGKDRLTRYQKEALSYIKSVNGIGGVARCVDDYRRILNDWIGRFKEGGQGKSI